MPLSSPSLRRFVKHALIAATGVNAPDRTQLASAFDVLCDRLRSRLHPMFGTAAVSALFARSHRVATAEFPWLRDVVPEDGERCSLAGVGAVAAQLEPEIIADGLAAVLAHDIGLLSTFIGADLVMPLVEEAWRAASLRERARTEDKR
jgi:hypothetical protein